MGMATAGAGTESDSAAKAAVTGRVLKVLPHFLDLDGQSTVSPSLFDRDAYQAHLRAHPEECSGIRYDVNWKVRPGKDRRVTLRLELKGLFEDEHPREKLIEVSVVGKGSRRRWTGLEFSGEDYHDFGRITAWRVTLWSDDILMDEQTSFLW